MIDLQSLPMSGGVLRAAHGTPCALDVIGREVVR